MLIRDLHRLGCMALFQISHDPDLTDPKVSIIRFCSPLWKPCITDNDDILTAIHAMLYRFEPDISHKQSSYRSYNVFTSDELMKEPHLRWIMDYSLPHQPKRVCLEAPRHYRELGRCIKALPLPLWRQFLQHALQSFSKDLFSDTVDTSEPLESHIVAIAASAWIQDSTLQVITMDRAYLVTARTAVQKLVEQVRSTLLNAVTRSGWEKETIEEMTRKVRNMIVIVGWHNMPHAEQCDSVSNTFDELVIEGHKAQYDNVWTQQHTTDRHQWRFMSGVAVNAVYNRDANVIYVPPAIMHPPFFTLNGSDVDNFAGIGAIIAHEMMHAFDYESQRIDASGRIRGWWSPRDYRHYLHQCRKIVKLFSEDTSITGLLRTHGFATINENIADMAALPIVYAAFNRSLDRKEADRFFQLFASMQLSMSDDSDDDDNHATDVARINLPLSCFQPFLDLYNVKDGQPMHTPKERRPIFIRDLPMSSHAH
jgi:predicted metalloendopeptidase